MIDRRVETSFMYEECGHELGRMVLLILILLAKISLIGISGIGLTYLAASLQLSYFWLVMISLTAIAEAEVPVDPKSSV